MKNLKLLKFQKKCDISADNFECHDDKVYFAEDSTMFTMENFAKNVSISLYICF